MGFRRVCGLSLLPAAVFLLFPFAAGAQSGDAAVATIGHSATATEPVSIAGTSGAEPFRLVFEPRVADSAGEPWSQTWGQSWMGGPGQGAANGAFPAEAHVDLLPLFANWHEDLAAGQSGDEAGGVDEDRAAEGYHWKGLLWQSLGFIGIEDGFRLATDHYLRHLTAEGPFWENYGLSLQHWDLTRWSDGDDFLVDDIGHPMQGAVSAFLEIQNSPSQRRLRFSNTSPYWKSRMKSFLWAAAFSTQQKLGPLGEAGLGNDGGYTYGLHCATEPCMDPNAKYTNNTGWTDLIMTPVGGTAWVVGEDLLDRFVSDRVEGDRTDAILPKILRGALNPTRTAANALRGKLPWYRDYEHPEVEPVRVTFESANAEVVRNLPRYEIFPHFNALAIPVNTADCWFCRTWTKGGGVGFSMRLSRWVDFDSDVDYQPNVSPVPSSRAGGSLLMATFGFRTGITTPHYALKVSLRPGFVSYDHAYVSLPTEANPTPQIGRVTHFATSLSINGDYGLSRYVALRYSFGNTPVRYLHSVSPPGEGAAPNFFWLSHDIFMTNENWGYQVGPVLRF